MKKLILVLALAVGNWAPVQAQGTYSSQGEVVDNVKAAVAAYLNQDWDAYRAAFADTAAFYPNQTEPLTMDQNIEQHKEAYSLVEDVNFVNSVYGEVENEGETWGLMWATWSAKVIGTGEELAIPVHVAIRHEYGKGVVEYGFWDNAPLERVAAAAEADL